MSARAEYGFREGTGTKAAAEQAGMPAMTTVGAWAAGRTGGGMVTAGTNPDRGVGIIPTGMWPVETKLTGFTIMVWARVAAMTVNAWIELFSIAGDPGEEIWLELSRSSDGAQYSLAFRNQGPGQGWAINGGDTLTVDPFAWHHYTLQRDGTNMRAYIDGVLTASGTYAGATGGNSLHAWTTDVGLTNSNNSSAVYDDLRFFDTTLTVPEITTWMNTPIEPAVEPVEPHAIVKWFDGTTEHEVVETYWDGYVEHDLTEFWDGGKVIAFTQSARPDPGPVGPLVAHWDFDDLNEPPDVTYDRQARRPLALTGFSRTTTDTGWGLAAHQVEGVGQTPASSVDLTAGVLSVTARITLSQQNAGVELLDAAGLTVARLEARMTLISGTNFRPAPRFTVTAGGATATSTQTATREGAVYARLAGVFDGSSVRVYLNGTLLRTVALVGVAAAVRRIKINLGADAEAVVDDVRVYSKALTASEVTQINAQMLAATGA